MTFEQWLKATYREEQWKWLLENKENFQYKQVYQHWARYVQGQEIPEAQYPYRPYPLAKVTPLSISDALASLTENFPGEGSDPYSWAAMYLMPSVHNKRITAEDAVEATKAFMSRQPQKVTPPTGILHERIPAKVEKKIRATTGYTPQYQPVFEETVGGVSGPTPWKDWFEDKYSAELTKYKAPLGELGEEQASWAELLRKAYLAKENAAEKAGALRRRIEGPRPTLGGTGPKAQLEKAKGRAKRRVKAYHQLLKASPGLQRERGWAEYLAKREPKLRQEYEERYPYGISGKPWAFQPSIRTVGF